MLFESSSLPLLQPRLAPSTGAQLLAKYVVVMSVISLLLLSCSFGLFLPLAGLGQARGEDKVESNRPQATWSHFRT